MRLLGNLNTTTTSMPILLEVPPSKLLPMDNLVHFMFLTKLRWIFILQLMFKNWTTVNRKSKYIVYLTIICSK